MNRREFMSWVSVGCMASFLPVAIAACSPTEQAETESSNPPPPPPTDSSESEGFEAVGTVTELDENGAILNKEFPGGAVLVIRNPEDAAIVNAVNPTCTHEGCTVEWNAGDRKYICPCHDAEYSADGTVLQGPAKESLATYTVKIEGDSVLVKSL